MKRHCAILTDFGNKDNFVSVMKGVILKINPTSKFIDITNEIPQGDTTKAHFQLITAYNYFPACVYLCVVDPGVGSDRKEIIVKYEDSFFVGPDNGVFSHFIRNGGKVYEIINHKYLPKNISTTFHGRDIFAPTAGALLKGVSVKKIARKLSENYKPVLLKEHEISITDDKIIGRIAYIDKFGNLITNIEEKLFNKKLKAIEINDVKISKLNTYYSEIEVNSVGALIGSHGFLEIFASQGDAAKKVGAKVGTEVNISFY